MIHVTIIWHVGLCRLSTCQFHPVIFDAVHNGNRFHFDRLARLIVSVGLDEATSTVFVSLFCTITYELLLSSACIA